MYTSVYVYVLGEAWLKGNGGWGCVVDDGKVRGMEGGGWKSVYARRMWL